MSTGLRATPLLKAAPEANQLADRLGGGDWRGIEIALMPHDVASEEALARAVAATRDVGVHPHQLAVTAEAPVGWPSGAFVRVDRLDDEARSGIERSAEFAAEVGSPVLTIHLFIPLSPEEFRGAGELDLDPVVARLGRLVSFVVAEINEPDPSRSPEMKAAYRKIERALATSAVLPMRARRVPADPFDWQTVLERRDPVPSVLELQERFGGQRVLLTGGGGPVGRALGAFFARFCPQRVTLVGRDEASLIA